MKTPIVLAVAAAILIAVCAHARAAEQLPFGVTCEDVRRHTNQWDFLPRLPTRSFYIRETS